MFKVYFKQAWQLLAQNKFISVVSILGTALAIMMVMSVVVVDQVQNSDMAPEVNRSKTFFIRGYKRVKEDHQSMGNIPYEVLKNQLSKLQTPKYNTIVQNWAEPTHINREGFDEKVRLRVLATDAVFWNVFRFDFKEGQPYSETEFESGVRNAVISQSAEHALFGTEPALSKTIVMRGLSYKIVGVVEDVSQIFDTSSAEIWIPYTTRSGYEDGAYNFLMVLENNKDASVLKQEIKMLEEQMDKTDAPWKTTFVGPDRQRDKRVGFFFEEREKQAARNQRKQIFIIALFLLVPAVNLSGFSMSRLKKRTEEIGVRKAFGAKRRTILMQVLYENFITSLLGGVIGLLLSYLVIYHFRHWLLGLPPDAAIPVSALISLPILAGVFIACLLINLLSAGIPAYRASKMSIVDSINQKER